ncbi:MAG: hypothetical protein ACTSPI_16395 [Candidatus Heimdallarchaeaceae archaeon]
MLNKEQTEGLVQSAILRDVKKEVVDSCRCPCDDYENCDYENRD